MNPVVHALVLSSRIKSASMQKKALMMLDFQLKMCFKASILSFYPCSNARS
jgi:hypothetical protein